MPVYARPGSDIAQSSRALAGQLIRGQVPPCSLIAL